MRFVDLLWSGKVRKFCGLHRDEAALMNHTNPEWSVVPGRGPGGVFLVCGGLWCTTTLCWGGAGTSCSPASCQ